MRSSLKLLVMVLLLAAPARALVPPWYFVHAQLRAAFEGGPITILELEQADGHWVVPVALSGPEAWEVNDGLATVLNRTFLGGTVRIEVRLPDGQRGGRSTAPRNGVASTLRTLRAALRGNPHVSGVFPHGDGVLIELKGKLLSFWADNLADRRGHAHFAPADLFREFLDFTPFTVTKVHFSYE